MIAIPLVSAIEESVYGGKAVGLGRAVRAGLPVPPGYALAVEAVEAVARGDGSRLEEIRPFLSRGVAVRSSAVGEDGSLASFAGQHETVLNVATVEAVVAAVGRVRGSAEGASARAYRATHGLDRAPRMGIVLQRLVEPESAGVLFTRNPVTGAEERVVESVFGLGEGLVSGLVTPDGFRLARDGRLLAADLGEKHVALRPSPSGGIVEEVLPPERAGSFSIGSDELASLAALATRAEEVYGPGLDLEWAIAGGTLHLLQCRAITTGEEREAA